jgi:hypothetical protein
MASTQRWIVAFTALALSGCISSAVAKGAVIGAVSGVALGAGTGVLISNDKLLGSSKQSQLELSAGASIGVGSLIGGVFGAIVGAMVGHQREDNLPLPPPYTASASQQGENARF